MKNIILASLKKKFKSYWKKMKEFYIKDEGVFEKALEESSIGPSTHPHIKKHGSRNK